MMKALLCTVPPDPLVRAVDRSAGEAPLSPPAIVPLIRWMQRSGYPPESYDYYDIVMLFPSDEEIREELRRSNPSVVGLSAILSTGYAHVKRISRLVKEVLPEAWIVLGGNVAIAANVILRKTDVDVCVVGDGEIAWCDFLKYTERNGPARNDAELEKIQGLAYLDGRGELRFNGFGKPVPQEDIPFADFEILASGLRKHPEAIKNYFRPALENQWAMYDPRSAEKGRKPNSTGLYLSKGCLARCTFCQRYTKGYRCLSLQALDEHLRMLRERFDVGIIIVTDECFGANKKHAYEAARLFHKHGMLWCVVTRCKSVTLEDMRFYYDHGCCRLQLGVESGSQKMLDIMEKHFTTQDVLTSVKNCIEVGLHTPQLVMVGMPGETDQTVMETGKFLTDYCYLNGIHPAWIAVSIFYALPLPGTTLYEYGQQLGVIGTDVGSQEEYLLNLSGAACSKIEYMNLNGAPLWRVLFWDFLIKFELMRGYLRRKKECGEPTLNAPASIYRRDVYKKMGDVGIGTRLSEMSRYRPKFHFISALMEFGLTRSELVARLPRGLVYPVCRALLYGEYLICKCLYHIRYRLTSTRIPNLYKFPAKAKVRLEDLPEASNPRDRSLRAVVMANRNKMPPAATLTEKNVRAMSGY